MIFRRLCPLFSCRQIVRCRDLRNADNEFFAHFLFAHGDLTLRRNRFKNIFFQQHDLFGILGVGSFFLHGAYEFFQSGNFFGSICQSPQLFLHGFVAIFPRSYRTGLFSCRHGTVPEYTEQFFESGIKSLGFLMGGAVGYAAKLINFFIHINIGIFHQPVEYIHIQQFTRKGRSMGFHIHARDKFFHFGNIFFDQMRICFHNVRHGIHVHHAVICPQRHLVAGHTLPDFYSCFVVFEIIALQQRFRSAHTKPHPDIGGQFLLRNQPFGRITQSADVFAGVLLLHKFCYLNNYAPNKLCIVRTGIFLTEILTAFAVAFAIVHTVIIHGVDHKFIRTDKGIRPAVDHAAAQNPVESGSLGAFAAEKGICCIEPQLAYIRIGPAGIIAVAFTILCEQKPFGIGLPLFIAEQPQPAFRVRTMHHMAGGFANTHKPHHGIFIAFEILSPVGVNAGFAVSKTADMPVAEIGLEFYIHISDDQCFTFRNMFKCRSGPSDTELFKEVIYPH